MFHLSSNIPLSLCSVDDSTQQVLSGASAAAAAAPSVTLEDEQEWLNRLKKFVSRKYRLKRSCSLAPI